MKTSVGGRSLIAALGIVLMLTTFGMGVAQTTEGTAEKSQPAARKPDVVSLQTPQPVVEKMLEIAEIKKGDVVYDLGCGDGRIVVTAAKKYGVKAVGVDLDPEQVRRARAKVVANRLDHLVTIRQADMFTLDLREATVVTLYLLPHLNAKLMPQLAKLRRGSRIVSHQWNMPGAKPAQVYVMNKRGNTGLDRLKPRPVTLYKWIVPWEKE